MLGGTAEAFVELLDDFAFGSLNGEIVFVLGDALLPVVDGEQHNTAEPGDHGKGDLEQVEQLVDVELAGGGQPRPAEEPQQHPSTEPGHQQGDDQPADHGQGHPTAIRARPSPPCPHQSGKRRPPTPAVPHQKQRREQAHPDQKPAEPVGHEG
ncbi:hypothetical protein [Amycolatopsis sp. NPDC021455]|uniref:hypothetical protein n=1 Tax=Amycolatopsis sp. NPDC021455 TaxID=3154901 RepID=UPI0033CB97F7